MGERLQLEISGLTDPGMVREGNEDAIRWNADSGWAVLADGMGGHMAGEVASQLAVDTLQQFLDEAGGSENAGALLREAVREANRRIHTQATTDIRCHNMGTTIVAVHFHDGVLHAAHVGDSRLYRYRGGELVQLSHDHSLVQELVDEGMLSREEAADSTHKNVITRALGLEVTVEVDLLQQPAEKGDIFLLCSDGLSDKIAEDELPSFLDNRELETAVSQLIDEAKSRGGEDNISVILVSVK